MARFYAEIQGNRGQASRMGTPNSGMWAHVRGWNVGVRVECRSDGDKDIIKVFKTSGSSGYGSGELIATFEYPEKA